MIFHRLERFYKFSSYYSYSINKFQLLCVMILPIVS